MREIVWGGNGGGNMSGAMSRGDLHPVKWSRTGLNSGDTSALQLPQKIALCRRPQWLIGAPAAVAGL